VAGERVRHAAVGVAPGFFDDGGDEAQSRACGARTWPGSTCPRKAAHYNDEAAVQVGRFGDGASVRSTSPPTPA
jgi:hypothetical protein